MRIIQYPNLKDFTKVGSCDVDNEQVAYFYDIIIFLYRKSHFIFVILITMLGYKKIVTSAEKKALYPLF